MKSIKTLGLFAVVVVALMGFVATAGAAKFTSGGTGESLSHSTLKKHVLTLTGSPTECESIGFSGTTTGKEFTEQVLSPSYAECKAFGFNATIDVNSCEYRIPAVTVIFTEHALLEIDGCGSGNTEDIMKGMQITVKIPFIAECIVDIPEQSSLFGVHYSNTTSPNRIDMKITASWFTANVTKSSGLCPLATGEHSGVNGMSYTGESTMTTTNGLAWDS